MENKIGQGLAVAGSAFFAAIASCIGMAITKQPECLAVMAIPAVVALFIMFGDGWD